MATPATIRPLVLHLSLIVGSDLIDGSGSKLGRVDDLIVRLGEDDYPPVTGILAAVAGRQVFVPAESSRRSSTAGSSLQAARLDLQPFERREQEVLLKKDVLDRQLINVDGARLVRANEIELARVDGWYRVVGVDVGLRGIVRRLLPRALVRRSTAGRVPRLGERRAVHRARADGAPAACRTRSSPACIRPSSPTSSKRRRTTRARRSSSAVGAATPSARPTSSRSSTPQHQLEFIEDRVGRARSPSVLARMETDDAADLLDELPEERREAVVRAAAARAAPAGARRCSATTRRQPAG